MESDSDHFESADENFYSDEEETKQEEIKSKNVCKESENIDPVSSRVKNISLENKSSVKNTEHLSHSGLSESISSKVESSQAEKTDDEVEFTGSSKKDNVEKTITNATENIAKKDERAKRPQVVEKKERPQKMKSKLGVKLGTKISTNINFDELEKSDKNVHNEEGNSQASNSPIRDRPPKPQPCWVDELGWKPFIKTGLVKEEDLLVQPSELYSQKSEKSDENYWDNEADYMELPQKESFKNVADKLSAGDRPQSSGSWGGWGNWGVSSILSTASLSVSTLTNSVSQGISTVLETGIGAPDPEELARIDKLDKHKKNSLVSEKIEEQEKQDATNQNSEKQSTAFGLGNLVSGVTHITKFVETTGTKVLSGGLDTLEVIGKKTMEVLQEGDPGFKKKKAFLGLDHDRPVLSQVLREAKEKAEEENKFLEERNFARKAHYETLFDDHQGLVHLEALEMLSKQCDIKLETLIESYTGNELTEFQETMAQIKELCEIPDEDEDAEMLDTETIKEKLETAIQELNVSITYEHLIKTWNETEVWLQNSDLNEKEIHQHAIETLAKLTAISVEQFHKAGELLLIKERRSTVDEADSLVQLTTTLTSLIGMAAGKFSEKLNILAEKSTNPDSINSLITNIFLEAANSSTYIQDAFQLLIPVLQAGAV